MDKFKITVAIPVYNTGPYLDVTLDSLKHQTMDSAEFEIICVNDCSTDQSKEVIEKYIKIMDNISLVDRKENSGTPSIPRNDAIDLAKGEYILFMDSDDFLGEETLERLYKEAIHNNSDVIFGKYIGVNGRDVPAHIFNKGNLYKADIVKDGLVYSLAPHKMFKRSFLKHNGISFQPEGIVGEDQLFVMQCYMLAQVITVMADYPYYFVRDRGKSNHRLKYVCAENFFCPFNKLLEFIDNQFIKDSSVGKIKIAFLNRFLQGSRLRPYLLSSDLTNDQKYEWMLETNKFIDNYLDDQIINSIDYRFHKFLQAVKENDLQKLSKISL